MSQHPLTSQYHAVRHPFPPTYTRHDCLLSLQCVFANVSFSLLPWETLLPSWLTSLCSRKIRSALFGLSPTGWQRTECREHHASDACPWLCTQTMETVNNTKIILLCDAVDRRSSSWQAFSSTSIWYIEQCTTELSASIIMQCCALKMPPSPQNYGTTKAIWKESRAHALSLTIFGYLNIWGETRDF